MTRSAPATFSVPGLYGQGPAQFTVGEGRLARPRFRTTASVSVGYDDNVFQTPTNGPSVPDQEVEVLVKPATPDTTVLVAVPSGSPMVPDGVREEVVRGEPAVYRTEKIPGVPPAKRIGSFITRTTLGGDFQFASRRTLFTTDFSGGVGYYWDRPGKKSEYTASLGLMYLRKLTGRAQFTFTASTSYQTQPDYALVNGPTDNNRGSYIPLNAKADLSYRLTPRFSTVTSLSYSSIYSIEKSEQSDDYGETTFGTELRYLFSPRLTLLGELRYSSQTHKDNAALDTNTTYLLVGGELTLSRRFTATLRVGEALQTYSQGGQKNSAPYIEATLAYRLSRGTTVQWNLRYGFEVPGSPDSEVIVARSGLTLTQIFSPRLQGSLSLNLVNNATATTSTITIADDSADTELSFADDGTPIIPTPVEPKTRSVTTEQIQNTIDATIAFQYALTRRWSFNLSYSYTMVVGPEDINDYYRQRVFLGAEYQF